MPDSVNTYINVTDENGTTKNIQSLSKHDFLIEENVGKTVAIYGYYNGISSSGEAKFVAVDIVE